MVARHVSLNLSVQTRLASFDVALFHRLRANGPAIYLAQPEGLGIHSNDHLGLKVRTFYQPTTWRQQANGQAFGPFFFLSNLYPALQAGLGKLSGLCPLKTEIATSKRANEEKTVLPLRLANASGFHCFSFRFVLGFLRYDGEFEFGSRLMSWWR